MCLYYAPWASMFTLLIKLSVLLCVNNFILIIPQQTIKHGRKPLQDRSQGHLLCNSSQTIIQIREIQVVRQPLQISLYVF